MNERTYSKTLYGWCLAGLILSFIMLMATGVYTRFAEVDLDLFKWLGRFHPVTLHTPVGLIPALIILEFYALRPRNHGARSANMIILGLAVVSAAVAACTGLLLGESGGYDAQIFARHKVVGVAMAMALLVGGFLRLRYYRTGVRGHVVVYWFLLLGASVAMVIAGHDGGSLTHGKNFLHEYQPDWIPGGEEEGAETASVDAGGVIGIFQEKCFSCHAAEKQKGDYRMDTREFAFTAGESEIEPIIPGQAMNSYLVETITLPADDDMVMPPEGKEQLTAEEIVDIIRWVNAGAPWAEPTPITIPEAATPKPDAPAAPGEAPAAPGEAPAVAGSAPAAPTAEATAPTVPPGALFPLKTVAPGVRILEKQADGRLLVSDRGEGLVEISVAPAAEDAAPLDLITALAPFKDSVVKLNIAHQELSPDAWKSLATCSKLKALHAPYSNASNTELDTLATLTGLSYLNLHGTSVSDLGVKKLTPLTALRDLYVDVTEVTVDGADAVRAALPECTVHFR